MDLEIMKKDGLTRVKINEAMTIYNASALKDGLVKAVSDAAEVELDLSSVKEMDSSGIQLLIMLKREAEARGNVMRLSSPGSATESVIELYRLGEFLGDEAG